MHGARWPAIRPLPAATALSPTTAVSSGPTAGCAISASRPVATRSCQGINLHGQVVGNYNLGGAQRAFLYGYRGKIHAQTALIDPAQGWTITAAHAINDAGQIAGEACDQTGDRFAG